MRNVPISHFRSGRCGRRPYANMHFAQLLLADLGGRVGERIRGRLRLRERDDVANAVGAGHVHDQPVETERNATMLSLIHI